MKHNSTIYRLLNKQRVHWIVGNHGENMPTGRDYLAAAQKADVFGGNAAFFLTSF